MNYDVDYSHNTLLSHSMPCLSNKIELLLVTKVNGTFD